MGNKEHGGRVTIPTNLDVVPETIELMKRWGADAIRDCDGTENRCKNICNLLDHQKR